MAGSRPGVPGVLGASDSANVPGAAPPEWRPVFARVPRASFIPAVIWDDDRRVVRRDREPDRWAALVRRDAPVITQLDDGDASGRGYVSSSASMPTVVAMMLAELDVADGMRVLEIGTGTGWNTALLAARLGSENVTSVEIDPALAAAARRSLADAGFRPTVATADGMAGWPENAPYDRVIATAAVQRVPYAWVAQTRPGGLVLTPWGTAFHNGTLLRLRVHGDGTGSGRFGADVGFMWTRSERTPHGSVEERVLPEHDSDASTTELHPYEPVGDFDASFAIGLRVPAMLSTVVHDGPAADNRFTVYLMDPATGSWASWRVTPETHGSYQVRQHGRRRLFAELAAAWRWWEGAGRPGVDRFGLTVTRDGQYTWLDHPETPIGPPTDERPHPPR
ncbi:protein-L-isoaspartate(D-aspartate) O-methyltransferase [Murinocardiopsis flavida]|uniref:Protein-L-isoaspartate O-methyltransferase n=1 Tax=Murinocardiopsis flavida TaxID=645275 RepID=A0A2P8DFH4_9ACTN|nr:methyltransferase domain-containing protein [Murinocardiopsis flavida]PSK95971.1 protein-L-isoaspartate(D-aspartate) O-methyltransferase [Murinocardiopsis flavida]